MPSSRTGSTADEFHILQESDQFEAPATLPLCSDKETGLKPRSFGSQPGDLSVRQSNPRNKYYSSVAYLTTLSLVQTVERRMVGRLVSSGLETMCKEAVGANFQGPGISA
jgi:hypothetical protein